MAVLDGNLPDGSPAIEWEVVIRAYCVGASLKVSFKRNNKRPDIERLSDYDEVWAICAREPKPGWRLLGRFLQPDHFIGLAAWPKGDLANRYDEAAEEVYRRWSEIFSDQQPWRGNRPADYMTGVLRDLDSYDG